MDYNKYSWLILCEDKSQYHFIQGWLSENKAKNIKPYGPLQKIGCAKSYVIDNFPNAVARLRSLSSYRHVALVVAIDADNDNPDDIQCKMPCADDDLVFFVIPKWSIETWIRFIKNPDDPQSLDESKTCRQTFHYNTKFGREGRNFSKWKLAKILTGPSSLCTCAKKLKIKKGRI